MGKRKGRGSAQTQPGGAYAGVMRWELVVAVYVHMCIYVKSALLQSAGSPLLFFVRYQDILLLLRGGIQTRALLVRSRRHHGT